MSRMPVKYLDYDRMSRFLKTYFNRPEDVEGRSVGRNREHDSGYFDIVRFFGKDSLDPSTVSVEYLDGLFTFNDRRIADFSRLMEIMLRLEGRLYEGPRIMKLADTSLQKSPKKLTVQACRYGDQAGSCFALDYVHPLFYRWGGTLRDYYLNGYHSREVRDNPLAICLGICAYLLVEERDTRYLLTVRRSAKLASLECSSGPSAAGSVDFVRGWRNLLQIVRNSLEAEVTEELLLSPDEYELVPLAYAREIFRGEKPQLFCLIKTDLSRREVGSRLAKIESSRREFDTFEFERLDANRSLNRLQVERLNHEAKMNYYLIEEYLSVVD